LLRYVHQLTIILLLPDNKLVLVPALLESIDIRGSIHDDLHIKSSYTLGLLLDFVFIATRAACPPQNAFSNWILCTQERSEVRWRPGQEASLAPPCSNLRSFGSKCTILKKVLVALLGLFGAPIVTRRQGNYAPLAPLVTHLCAQHARLREHFSVAIFSNA